MHSDTRKLRCLIVDDEPMAQEVLATHLGRVPGVEIVQQCNNAMEAFEALHREQIDLLFLDINMPVISGLSFLRSLKDPPAVILTTAYTEYAMEGYELDVVDYLLKPIPYDRLLKALKKAAGRLPGGATVFAAAAEEPLIKATEQAAASTAQPAPAPAAEKSYMFVKAEGKLVKVNFADIRYVEGMKDYLKIHVAGGHPVVTHQTMKAMEEQLPQRLFMRVHKSYIVALGAIRAIEGSSIHVDKAELPLSNTYREAVLGAIAVV